MSLEHILSKLDGFKVFTDEFRQNGSSFRLGNHQMVPVFDAVENGLRRFLLAYGTGAGKTAIPLEIIKHLKRKGEPYRTLVIAPKQTMSENWNEEALEKQRLSMKLHHIDERSDSIIPEGAEMVVINYQKFPESRGYVKSLIDYARDAVLLIIDEAHNIKNLKGKTSRGVQAIIEETKGKRMIALTASPAPNRIKDFGMILYTLDPDRYKLYRTVGFDASRDSASIWEMREQGRIRFFGREEVAKFHNLPELVENDPIPVAMSKTYAERYFTAYKDCFVMGTALNTLERVSIESMLHSEEFGEYLRTRLNEGFTFNFFSHLRNGTKSDAPIFEQLENVLQKCGARNIAMIHGDTPQEERRKIQKAMGNGELDALINQWACTQEGFSEVAGNRPICIVPLRSPFAPGMQLQIVGRSYRPGQFAPVQYTEFHPDSLWLRENMRTFVENYAEQEGVRVKTTWQPTLFAVDAYGIRISKERKARLILEQRGHLEIKDDKVDVDSLHEYASLLSKDRVLDGSDRDKGFGSGTRQVIRFVGLDYDGGLRNNDNADPLGSDYDREDVLAWAPGKINIFLANALEQIKNHECAGGESWKIADLGSCSSAVFAQARTLHQALQRVRGENVGLDHIVNVDGIGGFIDRARTYHNKGKWLSVLPKLSCAAMNEEELKKAEEILKDPTKRNSLDFLCANFRNDSFGKNYDAVIASQCLQYNDQTGNRDIEAITMNVNRALRMGGHYLIALTGNTNLRSSFTREQDVDGIKTILKTYGFDISGADLIEGKSEKKTTLGKFPFIHAVKVREHTNTYVMFTGDIVPPVYLPEIEVLTGGTKMENLRRAKPVKERESSPIPDVYFGEGGKKFDLYGGR